MCDNCAGSPSFRICAFWCFSVLFRGWYRLGWTTKHHNALKSTTLRAFWCFLVLCRYLFVLCACFEAFCLVRLSCRQTCPPPLKSCAFWRFFVIGIGLGGCQSAIKYQEARLSVLFGAFWCFLVVLMRLRGRQSCSSPPIQYPCFLVLFGAF